MLEKPDLPHPRSRPDFLGPPDLEGRLAQALAAGVLANGWLIAGGQGVGKATLAYRIARALLWRERPPEAATLDVPQSSQAWGLIASGAHPDLFTAERAYDEKKERYAAEIGVDVIRRLISFLNHTASMGGWRVAIVDSADELNRHSANALLKALEEPPPRTAIFILSAQPGRLLATIRSRCRRIDLRPLPDGAVAEFLVKEGAADSAAAAKIARAAGGMPGFALSLAAGDGAEAIDAVDAFLSTAERGGDVGRIAQALAAKDAEGVWSLFQSILVARIAERARHAALSGETRAGALADLFERVSTLFSRGDALNLDRFQLVLAAERAFRAAGPAAR
jgi:DNA polymerase-3 subunit delta'